MALFKLASSASLVVSLLLMSILPAACALTSNTTGANNTTVAYSGHYNKNTRVKAAINVPEGDQKTDLYFAFEAPDDYEWVGFGLGMVMDNSLMFVIYRSADNQGEPTVSPRVGTGHVMPEYYNGTVVNVLEGSEVANGLFKANIHCKNCRKWGEGNLDISSTSGRFFYAFGPSGSSLKSDDNNQRIDPHPNHPKHFNLNVKNAIGVNGVPPLDDGSENTDTKYTSGGDSLFPIQSKGLAFHAFVMAFAFSVVFPLGYLFLRLFNRIWVHLGLQTFGAVLTFVGMAAGIYISVQMLGFPTTFNAHQIIGLVAVGFVIIAMLLGGVGHFSFKRRGVPSPLMKGHQIVGPLAILLGFAAAVSGLLYNQRTKAAIGYVVFDLAVWAVILALVFMKKRRDRKRGATNTVAARNFRDAPTAYTHVRGGSWPHNAPNAPSGYAPHEQQVPLQTRGGGQSGAYHVAQTGKLGAYA